MLFRRKESVIEVFGTEIPEPRIFMDFLGFEKHVIQVREKYGMGIWPGWYDHANYYVIDMPPEKIFGPGEIVPVPSFVTAADYEFEIGCVVGEKALLTSPSEALHFFKNNCYLTIINDWSARDIQKKDNEGLGPANSKFVIGKSMGPKIIPVRNFQMDENGVLDIEMTLTFNGKQRSRSNYNSLYHIHPTTKVKQAWSFPRIMAWLGQQNISVQPGYIIGSGTIGDGCIAEFMAKVDPKTGVEINPALYPWLKDGDVVTLEAKGIGVLENKIGMTDSK